MALLTSRRLFVFAAAGSLAAGLLVPSAAAAPTGGSAATRAAGTAADYMVTRDCFEEQAFVEGNDAAVARVLPKGYTPVRVPGSGAPVLFVRGLKCAAVTIGDHTGPATAVSFGVTVETPDGTGCASAAPAAGSSEGDALPACNWYPLAWLATDAVVADWLGRGLPGVPSEHVPGIVFTHGTVDPATGGVPFHLSVPASTGTPVAVDAATRPRPGTLSVRGGYWHGSGASVAKLVFAGDLTSGDATGTVSAPAGSRVADLLGAAERPYLPAFAAVASEHWDYAVYRPQRPGTARGQNSFEGTCSAKGTVSFSPPATNTAQALHYDYPAKAACTGTLNGRSITDAPADWHQAGSAYGSCSGAQTTAPGEGTITFGTGEAVAFTLDFTSQATEIDFAFHGKRSGLASGHGTFLTDRTPPTVVPDCAGAGASTVPMDLTLSTNTPLVSAATRAPVTVPAAAPAAAAPPAAPAPAAQPEQLPRTGGAPLAAVSALLLLLAAAGVSALANYPIR